MKSNYKWYRPTDSFDRLDSILATSQANYQEVLHLPDRDKLTFTNGFYADCAAVFVDIRDSSSLPDKYKRPRLARLYRAYISEVVAILNGSEHAIEINIVGDGVWAVFDTPYMISGHADEIFEITGKVRSLVRF